MNYIFLYLLSILVFPGDINSGDWILVKKKGNIEVFVRQQAKKDFKEVRILTSANASMHELLSAMEDVDYHKNWVINTIDSKLIEKQSDLGFIYYISTDMPFPIKDRDLILEYQRKVDKQTGVVTTHSQALPSVMPEKDDFIRIKKYQSQYVLTPENNKVHIDYQMKVDPGGLLPAWLVNLAVTTGPIKTMEALFDLLDTGKYKDHKVRGLD